MIIKLTLLSFEVYQSHQRHPLSHLAPLNMITVRVYCPTSVTNSKCVYDIIIYNNNTSIPQERQIETLSDFSIKSFLHTEMIKYQ